MLNKNEDKLNLNESGDNEGDSSEGEGKREDRLPSPEVDQQHLVMWRKYFCGDDGVGDGWR